MHVPEGRGVRCAAQAFSAWIHICAVRLFVESILRYGLPPQFLAVLMKPVPKTAAKLRKTLAKACGATGAPQGAPRAARVVSHSERRKAHRSNSYRKCMLEALTEALFGFACIGLHRARGFELMRFASYSFYQL